MNAVIPIELPVYEAKNRLSALLAEVQKGTEFVITNRGVPVARLVPFESKPPAAPVESDEDFVARIRAMRKGTSLRGLSIKGLIDDGRKY